MASSIQFDIPQRSKAKTCIAYAGGGQVNGAQSAVTSVVVHAGHGLASGDKFLYALTPGNISEDRVFTVDSTGSTTVVFTGDAFSFPDGAVLVNIEADTVTINDDGSWPRPNYDGSTITMYSDLNGDNAITSYTIPADHEIQFWADAEVVWVLTLDPKGSSDKIYRQIGDLGANAGALTVTRASSAPTSPSYGDIWIQTNGTDADIKHTYLSDGTSDAWVEESSGEIA